MNLPISVQTVGLLFLSKILMAAAWYRQLKIFAGKPHWIAGAVSSMIARFGYALQVPANCIGYAQFSLAQLKIRPEAITLSVFAPFAMLYMDAPFKPDYVWAALYLAGALHCIFHS